ncbi:MAG: hypothetical protein IJ764_03845 [Bacteroidales bacterium]|nr:hypothetical protein [Bacteroidales bacterium]
MANRFRNIEPPVFEEETELLRTPKVPESTESQAEPASSGESMQESTNSKTASWSRKLLGGEMLTTRKALKQFPLIVLIVVCAILMVNNRYAVERLRKEVIATHKRIDQLSLEQIQLKSQYQQSIKISSIAQSLDTIGIHLITEPPLTLKN